MIDTQRQIGSAGDLDARNVLFGHGVIFDAGSGNDLTLRDNDFVVVFRAKGIIELNGVVGCFRRQPLFSGSAAFGDHELGLGPAVITSIDRVCKHGHL